MFGRNQPPKVGEHCVSCLPRDEQATKTVNQQANTNIAKVAVKITACKEVHPYMGNEASCFDEEPELNDWLTLYNLEHPDDPKTPHSKD